MFLNLRSERDETASPSGLGLQSPWFAFGSHPRFARGVWLAALALPPTPKFSPVSEPRIGITSGGISTRGAPSHACNSLHLRLQSLHVLDTDLNGPEGIVCGKE